MELRGERVVLRPLRAGDAPRLAELAAHPDVARWWPDLGEEELLEKARGKPNQGFFAVLVEGELAGLVQYLDEDDLDYRHAGIDVFLGAPYQARGLGTDACGRSRATSCTTVGTTG